MTSRRGFFISLAALVIVPLLPKSEPKWIYVNLPKHSGAERLRESINLRIKAGREAALKGWQWHEVDAPGARVGFFAPKPIREMIPRAQALAEKLS